VDIASSGSGAGRDFGYQAKDVVLFDAGIRERLVVVDLPPRLLVVELVRERLPVRANG
jgi:hypothetical protein